MLNTVDFYVNDCRALDHAAETLSDGEAQSMRLASQIGAGLVGVMYIFDEPSIALHQRDNERLLKTLIHLRDLGNTMKKPYACGSCHRHRPRRRRSRWSHSGSRRT